MPEVTNNHWCWIIACMNFICVDFNKKNPKNLMHFSFCYDLKGKVWNQFLKWIGCFNNVEFTIYNKTTFGCIFSLLLSSFTLINQYESNEEHELNVKLLRKGHIGRNRHVRIISDNYIYKNWCDFGSQQNIYL